MSAHAEELPVVQLIIRAAERQAELEAQAISQGSAYSSDADALRSATDEIVKKNQQVRALVAGGLFCQS
jgi:hypothetical protein